MRFISRDEILSVLEYPALVEHLRLCHLDAPAAAGDILLVEPGEPASGNSFLTRTAWRRGKVLGLKAASIFPGNLMAGLPSIHSALLLFDGERGTPLCVMDGDLITCWKTAADSALGARLMARPDAERLLMVGAGTMAEHLIRAHLTVLPGLRHVAVWNRTATRAAGVVRRMAEEVPGIRQAGELEKEIRTADVVCCATAAQSPLVKGAWLQPGAHLDLVGSFMPHMREADPETFGRAKVALDWRPGTLGQCGELIDALRAGTLREEDILGDLYDVAGCGSLREGDDEITVYKNGGGGHLDLMTAEFVADRLMLGT
jgi:ornithine cyclodeaminase